MIVVHLEENDCHNCKQEYHWASKISFYKVTFKRGWESAEVWLCEDCYNKQIKTNSD